MWKAKQNHYLQLRYYVAKNKTEAKAPPMDAVFLNDVFQGVDVQRMRIVTDIIPIIHRLKNCRDLSQKLLYFCGETGAKLDVLGGPFRNAGAVRVRNVVTHILRQV